MQKEFKLSFDGGDSGSKKRRGYGGACGGVWWSLCLAGIWRVGGNTLRRTETRRTSKNNCHYFVLNYFPMDRSIQNREVLLLEVL
jgi:hypothetical protein